MLSESLVRRLCIKLSQATFSSAKALYDELTYGELMEWAEDVQATQNAGKPQREEAINVESEILKEY